MERHAPGGRVWAARHGVWLLVAATYLCASPYSERVNNPNENVRVWATRAIVVHGVLDIDAVVREWGDVNDKAKSDRHLYSSKAPGVSFLGVPVLWAHSKVRALLGWGPPGKRETTFWLRLFAVKVPLCAFLWAFARYVQRATDSALARDLLLLGLGLGTMLYPYGGMFVGHALAAAAAFSGFLLVQDPPRGGSAARTAAAGFFIAAAVVLEYQALLVALAVAVYALARQGRRALWLIAGATPPAVALGAYHRALFGKPWSFPYANIENPVWARTVHATGFHGLAWPHLETFPTFLFSPAYGLFMFSPILLAGLVAAIWMAARRATAETWLVLAVAGSMFLFLSGMSNWRGGWCVGPRYIASVVPFLFVPLVQLWPEISRARWIPAALLGLTIPAVFLNVVSGAVYPHYPEVFDNPVFDLALPLLRDGYTPYGLGWSLGLRGAAAMLPVALLVAGALALIAAGDEPPVPRARLAQAGVALAVAATFLVALGAFGRAPRPAEASAQATVRAMWEPRDGVPVLHGRQ